MDVNSAGEFLQADNYSVDINWSIRMCFFCQAVLPLVVVLLRCFVRFLP